MDQGNAKQEVRDEQDSLAPVALDRLTVEEEAALMQTGKGGKLAVIAVVAVLLGAGATFWLKQLDARQAYVGAAASVRELHAATLEPFARCALPEASGLQLTSKESMLSALERSSERMGPAYGRVLARCQPLVEALPSDLAKVQAPAALAAQLKTLASAANELGGAIEQYRTHLGHAGRGYDYVQALPFMEKIASAWGSCLAQHAELDAQVARSLD